MQKRRKKSQFTWNIDFPLCIRISSEKYQILVFSVVILEK